MNVLKEVVLAVSGGRRSFAPEGNAESDIRGFQKIAQALFHAEKVGLIGKIYAHKTAEYGEWLVNLIDISEGLTYEGMRSVSDWTDPAPSDESATSELFGNQHLGVRAAWQRAVARRKDDPAGAITAARTLLETVCKHILDERAVPYRKNPELHELYKLVAAELKLERRRETDEAVSQILGGCSSIVSGIGVLRNKLGDSHGNGLAALLPEQEEAEFSVNIAGCLAVFLIRRASAIPGASHV